MDEAHGEREDFCAHFLRKKRQHSYSFEDNGDGDNAGKAKVSRWNSRINKLREDGQAAEQSFRDDERKRIDNHRANLSDDQKDRIRELQRIRSYKYRQRKKEKEAAVTTRREAEKLKQSRTEQREKACAYMREWRKKQPQAKHNQYNQKRMTRYYGSKEQKTSGLNDLSGLTEMPTDDGDSEPKEGAAVPGSTSTETANGPTQMPTDDGDSEPNDGAAVPGSTPSETANDGTAYTTPDAKRKAASRFKLPTDPAKFAETIAYKIQKASPRKRVALERLGLGKSLSPFEQKMKENLKEHLTTLASKSNKVAKEDRKRLVQVLTQKAQLSIAQMSKQLGQRWQFVKAASCLPVEEEEMQAAAHGNCIPEDIASKVNDFFCRPEASIVIPDKKMVKKDLVPRACLTKSLKKFYENFCHETDCRDISFSTFKRLRPQHILTVKNLKRTSCVCKTCANIAQKLEALLPLCKAAGVDITTTPTDALDRTMCKDVDRLSRLECAKRKCPNCGIAQLLSLFQSLQQDRVISWFQWQMESMDGAKRMNNITKQGAVSVLIHDLATEMDTFSAHIVTAMWQYGQLRRLREQLPAGNILTLMDFAQNYRCEYQDEVQSAHWSYQQATVFPTVTYYRCVCGELATESVVVISENLTKDGSTVHHFNRCVLLHLKEKRGLAIEKQFQFTDGAGAQFKSKEPFADISHASEDYGIVMERSFFGSSHGKGPCDGVGGIVKAAAKQAVLGKQAVIRTAAEMFQHLSATFSDNPDKQCCHSRRVFLWVDKADIPRDRPGRRPRTAVPRTMQLHCIRSTGVPNVVEYRGLSCYCEICITGVSCPEMDSIPEGRWQRYKFWPLLKPGSAPSSDAAPPPPASTRPSTSDAAPPPPASTSDAAPPPPAFTRPSTSDAVPPPPASTSDAVPPPPASTSEAVLSPPASTRPSTSDAVPPPPASTSEAVPSPPASTRPSSSDAASPPPVSTSDAPPPPARTFDAASPQHVTSHAPNSLERRNLFSYLLTRMVSMDMTVLHHFVTKEVNMMVELYPIHSMSTIGPQPTDALSVPLYPTVDMPSLIPVKIKADGNCLPRCGSMAVFANQDSHEEMRVRLVAELVTYKQLYMEDEFLARGLNHKPPYSIAKAYMSYSGMLPKQMTTEDDLVSSIFDCEVMDIKRRSRDMGMWQLHALSSVLKRPILSAYPPGRGFNVRNNLHRLLLPREKAANQDPFVILWTSTKGDQDPPSSGRQTISWFVFLLETCCLLRGMLPQGTSSELS